MTSTERAERWPGFQRPSDKRSTRAYPKKTIAVSPAWVKSDHAPSSTKRGSAITHPASAAAACSGFTATAIRDRRAAAPPEGQASSSEFAEAEQEHGARLLRQEEHPLPGRLGARLGEDADVPEGSSSRTRTRPPAAAAGALVHRDVRRAMPDPFETADAFDASTRPASTSICQGALEQRHRDLSRALHPDRYAARPPARRRLSPEPAPST